MILIAVLWAVYISECFVRCRPGEWIFRRSARRTMCGVNRPDVTFWNERFGFVWTSAWPVDIAVRCSGDDLGAERCRARLDAVTRETRLLRIAAAILFILLLVLFPLLILVERLLPLLLPFAAAVTAGWGATLVLFFRSYRRVHNRRPPLETWLTQALSPIALIASPGAVLVNALEDAHPVAVASVMCPEPEFLRIARLCHFDAPGARLGIERLAASRGLAETLTAPPKIVDAGISHYCRRCHATYVGRADTCIDCPGVMLSPLKTAKTSVESSVRNADPTISRTSGPHDIRLDARGHLDGRTRQRTRHTG
jgi:hypothetical protein